MVRTAVNVILTVTAVSELLWTGSTLSSGFFSKKKPPFTTLKKSRRIPKLL